MAIYYCDFAVYSRSHKGGKAGAPRTARDKAGTDARPYSALEGAAYISHSRLRDERSGRWSRDYSKKEDLAYSAIMAPVGAPSWVHDRQRLWSEVERREDASPKRATAQLFRRMIAAIPRELDLGQQIALVRAFVQDRLVGEGMIADVNIHHGTASDGGDQPHVHIQLTMGDVGPDGFGNKRRDWNDVDFGNKAGAGKAPARAMKGGFLDQRRAAWSDYCNAALEEAGFSERVDHRSYKERGIDRLPQPKLGKAKHAERGQPWVEKRYEHAFDVSSFNHAVQVGVKAAGLMVRAVTSPYGAIELGVAVGEWVAHATEHIIHPPNLTGEALEHGRH